MPCPTLTTKDRIYIMQKEFILSEYGNSFTTSLDSPAPTICTTPKQKICTFTFLFDFQYKNEGTSVDVPCPTLIARQDKKPKYVVNADKGSTNITITRHDNLAMRELKTYMLEHGIEDVKMRPLHIKEMLLIMGFPATMKMVGTKTEQKKYIGNAVVCDTVYKLIAESYRANIK